MARVDRVLEDIFRQGIIKVMERQVKQSHHFFAVLALYKASRGIARIHGLPLKRDLRIVPENVLPRVEIGVQISQDTVDCPLALSVEMAVDGSLDGRCRSSRAGAEIDERIRR